MPSKTNAKEHKELKELVASVADCEPEDVRELKYEHYGLRVFRADNGSEYAIGTDEMADEACKEYIKNTIWAFTPTFIMCECNLPAGSDDAIRALQEKCEGANEAILAMVKGSCGLDSFVESAISSDGRGHFLAMYDGDEHEIDDHYAYRIN